MSCFYHKVHFSAKLPHYNVCSNKFNYSTRLLGENEAKQAWKVCCATLCNNAYETPYQYLKINSYLRFMLLRLKSISFCWCNFFFFLIKTSILVHFVISKCVKVITYCVQEFYYKMWQIITKCSIIT